jgi:AAA family ATP:ADP antiporter
LAAGWLVWWAGIAVTLCILPLVYLASFVGLGASASLGMLMAAQIAQRGTSLGLMVPAEQALFTVVTREQKYKAKAFIDTAVFRGGDVLASWIFLQIDRMGWTFRDIAQAAVPLVLVWCGLAYWVGREAVRMGPAAGTQGSGGK